MVHIEDRPFELLQEPTGLATGAVRHTVSLSAAQLHQSRVEKIHAMLDTSKVPSSLCLSRCDCCSVM